MTNAQELPITDDNIRNLKVGDEILVGISREKSHWLPVEDVDGMRINEFLYDELIQGVLRFYYTTCPLDIHAIRKAVEIPEGWTKYDPQVLPPDDAEVIEMRYKDGTSTTSEPECFVWDTKNYTVIIPRTMYRVTKWKTEATAAQQLAACLCGEYTEDELVEKLEAFAKEIRG